MLRRHDAAVPDLPLALRRLTFALLGLSLTLLLLWLAVRVLAPGGWTPWEMLVLACFAGTAPWTALCAANALVGGVILLRAPSPAAAVLPVLRRARPGASGLRTAIAVCIRNEAMAEVLPPLARLLDGLEAAGAADRFTLWFLSDTQDAALAAAEEQAIAAFRGGRIAVRYRRRTGNTGFKAGNVMDFLDHHAGDAELMLCLDADSEMTAPAVLRLVACMAADPQLAILQQLIVGRAGDGGLPAAVPVRHAGGHARAGPPARPGGRGRRGRIGATTPSSASSPSAAIAGWSRCPMAAPSCRTTRSRRCGCTPRAGRSAACRWRRAAWRATRPPCRNSWRATCAGPPATCSTGTCCACRGRPGWAAGSWCRPSCCSSARRSGAACWPSAR